MTDTVFEPRVSPRSFADAVLSLGVGTVQVAILFGFPAIIGFLLTSSLDVAIGSSVAAYLVFASFIVRKLAISSTGIRFPRLLGSPKFVPWDAVVFVQEAPRRELIWHGWLWPLFPSREMTPSFTSIGHYRIQFGSEYVYFPPREPKAFLAAIHAHLDDDVRNASRERS
jgi:hypothetical protein